MTAAEIEKHAQEISQSYQADKNKTWSIWAKNFDKMATKTVLKLLLKNWGVKSVEMQQALQSDFSVVSKTKDTEFVEEKPAS